MEHGVSAPPKNWDELENVAGEIKKECDKRNLGIMMLQPFNDFDAMITEATQAIERLVKS